MTKRVRSGKPAGVRTSNPEPPAQSHSSHDYVDSGIYIPPAVLYQLEHAGDEEFLKMMHEAAKSSGS